VAVTPRPGPLVQQNPTVLSRPWAQRAWHWATFQCRSKSQYAALSGQLSHLLHNSLSKQTVTPTRYIATSLCPTFINVRRNNKATIIHLSAAEGRTALRRVQQQKNLLPSSPHCQHSVVKQAHVTGQGQSLVGYVTFAHASNVHTGCTKILITTSENIS
jgi:hypothetical protein